MQASCVDRGFSELEEDVLDAYIGYYGRPAGPGGLEFWTDELEERGGDLGTIIDAFGTSAEFVDRFGSLDSEQLVTNIYLQLFDREPEEEGLDHFVDLLDSGASTLPTIALDILGGAQNADEEIVDNRNEVARHFVSQAEFADIELPDSIYNSLLEEVDEEFESADEACDLVDSTIVSLGGMIIGGENGSCECRGDYTDVRLSRFFYLELG